MIFNFLGDSITEGVGAERAEGRYSSLVCAHFQAKENNYGVSGSRIAPQRKPEIGARHEEWFFLRAQKMSDADFTFVFGGTNDYGHGDAPLGDFSDETPDTFYGAFRQLVSYLVASFGEKLCFILPLPRYLEDSVFGENGIRKKEAAAPLCKYTQAEKEILQAYGAEYLDLSEHFATPTDSPKTDWTEDGLHPNAKGHKRLAELLISYLQKKGF